jgi:hypothetical protein
MIRYSVDFCSHAVVVIDRLFENSAAARRMAMEGDAIPALLEVLRREDRTLQDNEPVSLPMRICNALNHLFFENTENNAGLRLAREGGIEPIEFATVKAVGALGKIMSPPYCRCIICFLDKTAGLRITNEVGIEPLAFTTGKAVGPNVRRRFELKDDDMLARLAMFLSVDGMLAFHYSAA